MRLNCVLFQTTRFSGAIDWSDWFRGRSRQKHCVIWNKVPHIAGSYEGLYWASTTGYYYMYLIKNYELDRSHTLYKSHNIYVTHYNKLYMSQVSKEDFCNQFLINRSDLGKNVSNFIVFS